MEKGAGHPRRTALHGQNQESKRRHCTFEELTEAQKHLFLESGPEAGEEAEAGPWKTPKAIYAKEQLTLFWGKQRAVGWGGL